MNRRKTLVAAFVLLATAATLLTSAASGATGRATVPFPQTVTAANSYLASLGIDARTVVIQRGARNYAGPKCPGKGWTCTTSTRVLQLGKDANKVECTGGTVMGQSCTIVQNGSRNSARCVERSSADVIVQDCNITQTGDRNTAVVDQAVEANGGPAQDATQTAEVTQNATAKNDLTVKQHVHQHAEDGDAQVQDAHQELTSTQTATGSGDNSSAVKQDQNQDAHNAATSQSQNTNPSTTTPCPAANLFFFGSDPNQCAFVQQTADAGDNTNSFDQSVDEDAHSNASAAQSQGSFQGGIKAQASLFSATGSSRNIAHQQKSQDARGGGSQVQIDPMGCCGFTAEGNAASSETLDQSSRQSASNEATAVQQLSVFGFVHAPTGSCAITQRASNNADSSSESASTPTCAAGLGFTTSCTSGVIPELTFRRLQQAVGACESAPFTPGDFELRR